MCFSVHFGMDASLIILYIEIYVDLVLVSKSGFANLILISSKSFKPSYCYENMVKQFGEAMELKLSMRSIHCLYKESYEWGIKSSKFVKGMCDK